MSTNHPLTEEHKKKLSDIRKKLGIRPPSCWGRVVSLETRQKISNSLKGIKHTPERNLNVSIAMRKIGNKPPSRLGVKRTVEERRKQSETVKRLGYKPPRLCGSEHPCWRGGIAKVNDLLRHGVEGTLWRLEVFKRDNWTCHKCFKRGGKLTAHHILNFSSNPEGRFDLSNGITFCVDCHKLFHRKYGIKRNSREQVDEFLGCVCEA